MVDIEVKKKCSRCNRLEGDVRHSGDEVVFSETSKRCDRCHEYNRNIVNPNRNSYAKSKFPTPHDKCVYAFKEGDEIVYIGESCLTSFRLNEHYLGHRGFAGRHGINKLEFQKRFTWHILWHGNNDDYRISQEKELIKLHQPKFNKTHKL